MIKLQSRSCVAKRRQNQTCCNHISAYSIEITEEKELAQLLLHCSPVLKEQSKTRWKKLWPMRWRQNEYCAFLSSPEVSHQSHNPRCMRHILPSSARPGGGYHPIPQ